MPQAIARLFVPPDKGGGMGINMKLLIQRVSQAGVTIDGEIKGRIGRGFLVLIGVCDSDTEQTVDLYIRKLLGLRIFEDNAGKTNLSLKDVGGELLLVSQFTLYADCRKGNRPSFIKAGNPEHAKKLYEYMIDKCREAGYTVQTGEFGADMKVSLVNDGPFTIMLDDSLY